MIYRSPLDSVSQFLGSLTDIIDFSLAHTIILLWWVVLMLSLLIMPWRIHVIKSCHMSNHKFNGVINLIKGNTCFKGQGSDIDLILNNRRFSFKNSNSYETVISDHHHFKYSMLKSNLSNSKPKLVNHRDYIISYIIYIIFLLYFYIISLRIWKLV